MSEQAKPSKALVQPNLKTEVALAIADKGISDKILNSFSQLATEGQLTFPQNYNLGNQLKLAYLNIIQNPETKNCTPNSIGQALSEMTLQGLEIDKKQCYFIRYGTELHMFRSYFGDQAVAYRTELVKDIKAIVIYEGDEIETDIVNDEEVVTKHHTSFENRDHAIVGAYAVATLPDGSKRYCIMTKKEIDANWRKAKNSGQTQRDFPQEMSKRTVIRRLVKNIFNTANTKDNYKAAVIASFNRTTEDEYSDSPTKGEERKTNIAVNIIPQGEDLDDDLEEPTQEEAAPDGEEPCSKTDKPVAPKQDDSPKKPLAQGNLLDVSDRD